MTRRWGRGRLPRWPLAAVAAAIVAGILASTHDPFTGWWRLAPDWLLLRSVSHVPGDAVWLAICIRIDDGDPRTRLARPESLSYAEWERLALVSARIAESARDDKTFLWAMGMLAYTHPYAEMVDVHIQRILRGADCNRRVAIAVCLPSSVEARGGASAMWRSEYIDILTDPGCLPGARGVTVLARLDPLPEDLLVDIASQLAGKQGARPIWDSLALGLARGRAPLEQRTALLFRVRWLGDPDAIAAVDQALAEIGSGAYPNPANEPSDASRDAAPLP